MAKQSLSYQGQVINERGEMLSLTDMWRADGSDANRRPADWLRIQSTLEFVEHISSVVGQDHHELIQSLRGTEAGTWAHWQIGMAYAKYLSPEFHAWCNSVVRDYMEGKLTKRVQHIVPVTPIQHAAVDLDAWMVIGRLFDVPMHLALQEGTKDVMKRLGVDVKPLLIASPYNDRIADEEVYLEPTDLGIRLGLAKTRHAGVLLNRALATIGWQSKNGDQWQPTDEGKPYCFAHSWEAKGKEGYNLKWSLSAVKSALMEAGIIGDPNEMRDAA